MIKDNIDEVLGRISAAAARVGRRSEEIRLVAVGKTFPPGKILDAYGCGLRAFGENRIQELEAKRAALPPDIEWHLIGRLQSNKARKAVVSAEYIHSVDSVHLLERIARIAHEEGRRIEFLLEFNVSGEESKTGFRSRGELERAVGLACSCQAACFRGFMTMAPYDAPEGELRRIFSELRKLRDDAEAETGVKGLELSMGMSSDFEIAVEEGATMVRVGTLIFGDRGGGAA